MSIFSKVKYLVIAFSCSLLFFSCASPQAPTGGVGDSTPPTIIEVESTPNRQTNFKEDEIVLTFDEWVTLKDVYNQLVISPPMPDEPEIRQKGKSIIVELPDSLRENTTYTINFGNAITDLNEGNILENYVYVFSTGPSLDSIKLNGTVVNAITLVPEDDVWVMLYTPGEDSAVYKRKPDYIAKSNKDGKWSMSFLPVDSFEVVALKDENVNFLYDQEAEWIGWLPALIYTGDLIPEVPPVYIFPREDRTYVQEVIHTAPGWMKIVVDAPFPKPMPQLLPPPDNPATMWDGDTLHIWYDPENNYSGYALLEDDSTLIRISSEPSMLAQSLTIRQISGRLRPGGTAEFVTNVPVTIIDAAKILVLHDSLPAIPLTIEKDPDDIRQFTIRAPWIAESRYPLLFLPGAITDFWGRSHDTIRQSIVVSGSDQFGDLTLTIDGLDSTKQYVINLKQGEQIVNTFVVKESGDYQVLITGLSPAKYVIEIVEDLNRNRQWDTGDYERRRLPERKQIFNPENLRAGWEQEVKMTWK